MPEATIMPSQLNMVLELEWETDFKTNMGSISLHFDIYAEVSYGMKLQRSNICLWFAI